MNDAVATVDSARQQVDVADVALGLIAGIAAQIDPDRGVAGGAQRGRQSATDQTATAADQDAGQSADSLEPEPGDVLGAASPGAAMGVGRRERGHNQQNSFDG
jgi:hypothetical protein